MAGHVHGFRCGVCLFREGRHVIFLLEDLECFLQECKSRVLYTLLDLLQRANVRAVVIGISCMISVLDLMEKRARSRFSHKVVVVHAPSSSSSEVEVNLCLKLNRAHYARSS